MGIFDLLKPSDSKDFLTKPGDKASIEVTKTGRKVAKASRATGEKIAFTEYKDKIVKTEVFKKKK